MNIAELKMILATEMAKPPSLQDRDLIDVYEFKIRRKSEKASKSGTHPLHQARHQARQAQHQAQQQARQQAPAPTPSQLSHRTRTLNIEGCDIIVIEFRSGSRTIGWATNSSCGDGPLPTTLGEVFPIGALCFLIALYMSNLQFFQQKNMQTPRALVEFLRRFMPAEISHGQFEAHSFPSVAGLLDVQFEVRTSRPDIAPNTSYGNGQRLQPVHLDVATGHYMVPSIDVQPITTPPRKQIVVAPPVLRVCPACTFENPANVTNCEVCGEGFNGSRPYTPLG